jgi:hypothetical protein
MVGRNRSRRRASDLRLYCEMNTTKPLLVWSNEPNRLQSKSYICGYCGTPIASDRGWVGHKQFEQTRPAFILVCHKCSRPTFIDYDGHQTPGIAFGQTVNDISDSSVAVMYEEARKATSAGSFTAAVLCCRKLLMHIAVAKGATAGASFVTYVDYLANNNFVPPDAKGWVDHIRTRGNEANHEIITMKKEDAEELVSFVEMLLKIIYEFPAAAKRKYGPKTPAQVPAPIAPSKSVGNPLPGAPASLPTS